MADEWVDWWRRRGEERLSLLLWALWNPIGPVPPNEYEGYTGAVAAVLRRARREDVELVTASGGDLSDFVQRQRNELHEKAVEELAAFLGDLSDREMAERPNAARDRHAAETLLDWHEWEMNALGDDR